VTAAVIREKSSSMVRVITRALFLSIAIISISYYFYTQLVLPAREKARSMSCGSNLKQVGIGLLNYEYSFRSLPISVETDSDGRLRRSWRTQICPSFMEIAISSFYDEKSSWDSPTNTRLLNGTPIQMFSKDGSTYMSTIDRYPSWFNCPSCRENNRKEINYVVVSGKTTAFPKNRSVKLSEITDGLENTILVVESITCRPDWTEPRDLEFETMSFEINSKNGESISSLHPLGPLVCFADLGVYHVSDKTKASDLKAMLTVAGDEHVVRDDLIKRGVLVRY